MNYSMGRGGSGGGGMFIRTAGRVLRTGLNNGLQDSSLAAYNNGINSNISTCPTSPTKDTQRNFNTLLSLTSPACTGNNSNDSGCYEKCYWGSLSAPISFTAADFDDEWECVDDFSTNSGHDRVFGSAPSQHEVENALLSLQQVMSPVSRSQLMDGEKDSGNLIKRTHSLGSNLDWVEPSMQIYDHSLARPTGLELVYDAFYMLQTEPSVQKMVESLSSDQAVWDAVLNNEAVREIRESYRNAPEFTHSSDVSIVENLDESSDFTSTSSNILMWILGHMKAKLLEVIGTIAHIASELFKPLDRDRKEHEDVFPEKLVKSSFLITVLVLMLVVVARGQKA